MFIVYQIRSMEHKTVPLPSIACPLCQSKGGVHLQVRQKYSWFLGPIGPGIKYGLAYCLHCDRQITNTKWPDALVSEYKLLKKSTKTPLRLWRGMVVIPCILGAMVLAGKVSSRIHQQNQQNREARFKLLARDPLKGDIYKVSESAGSGEQLYTYLMVSGKQSGDTLFLLRYQHPSTDFAQWFKNDSPPAPGDFSGETVPVSLHLLTRPDKEPFLQNLANPYGDQLSFDRIIRNGELYKKY